MDSVPAIASMPGPTKVEPASGKVIYTCPMHPEVRQDHPGNCPKCGSSIVGVVAVGGKSDE